MGVLSTILLYWTQYKIGNRCIQRESCHPGDCSLQLILVWGDLTKLQEIKAILYKTMGFPSWVSQVALSSVQFSYSVMSDSLWPHGLQHARLPYPSPTLRAYSNSCPLSQWCHPNISSSVLPISSCLESFLASGFFPMSQFFTSGGQSTEASASASVLPMNIQEWFPLGWTGWISLQPKELSRVFCNTTIQKHQFFHAQLS